MKYKVTLSADAIVSAIPQGDNTFVYVGDGKYCKIKYEAEQ